MEDRQPNEVRLDRKGKSTIPAVKVVRRGGHHSFRGFDSGRGGAPRGRPPNRPFNQRNFGHHPITPHFRNYSNKISSASSSNVSGRSFDHVKLEPSVNIGQSDQRPFKRTKLGSQQSFSGDSQSSERRFPKQGLPHTNISLDLPSQCPQGSSSNHEVRPKTAQKEHAVFRKSSKVI
ncbi:hypothetical protein K503DRAFT_262587 [Rhizopogon vinicolor AM-OR11-026]|uniref:Uncharacterized protein n=1 Tax=Rhizopogon vinicolor AM-OR11-026 TaxID=1314800 RepID=A0A1B7NDG3_9AGAM|nr:hypothetical protein K503DRAFT_262587 [Rhizopogon vinicolor AM-OR11-026]